MDKRKVVIRKLPPSASEADVREVVDKAAKGMYTWFSFVPGKARYVAEEFSLYRKGQVQLYGCLEFQGIVLAEPREGA